MTSRRNVECGRRLFKCGDGGVIFCTQPTGHEGECRGVWREDR